MEVSKKDYCKKCKKVEHKRLVRDKRHAFYYSCSKCMERSTKKYREKNWEYTLAKKANSRKKADSDILCKEDIVSLFISQNGKCALSGVDMNNSSKWDKPSLDRIDNAIGYRKNNIQLVTWRINHSRGEFTVQEFIDLCKKVAETHKQ